MDVCSPAVAVLTLPCALPHHAIAASARIGAIHSVVFAGFSAEALRARVIDSECKLMLTADEGLRAKKVIKLKSVRTYN